MLPLPLYWLADTEWRAHAKSHDEISRGPPLANREAAARKLLEIVLAKDIDAGQYTYRA
jgi:hypothetical protein